MPGRYFLTTPVGEVAAWMGLDTGSCDNQPPRRNVAPGEEVVVGVPEGLRMMRWGIIPVGRKNARGRPVMETLINARSETVFDKSAYEGVNRALIPADGWYEWTGETRKKQAWRITPKDGGLMAFAAIYDVWQAPGGLEVPQVASVTCEPNGDVRDIHHRMGVILFPEQFDVWLNGSQEDAAALMQPLTDGSLRVEVADDVNWTAP
ncbi:SOS response-associated peptidase [Shimia ponticola]|uniref:SOS response-associated peptidase n=1 Tax=Shimia ponticola TaxID=2582893 RepID=UPI0011BF0AC7|nr:SOS response-associated peptidase [Shimia ponticola]